MVCYQPEASWSWRQKESCTSYTTATCLNCKFRIECRYMFDRSITCCVVFFPFRCLVAPRMNSLEYRILFFSSISLSLPRMHLSCCGWNSPPDTTFSNFSGSVSMYSTSPAVHTFLVMSYAASYWCSSLGTAWPPRRKTPWTSCSSQGQRTTPYTLTPKLSQELLFHHSHRCMSSYRGRKPEYRERTHRAMRRACTHGPWGIWAWNFLAIRPQKHCIC